MRYEPHIALGPHLAARACAEALVGRAHNAIRSRGVACIGVSGGSTPKLMFDALVGMDLDWSRVQLYFVDERIVPPEHELSNYGMTRRHLIEPANVPQGNVHRIPGELDPEEAAARYGADIRDSLGLAPEELPEFDVLQCGIGADGHTASLFPGERLIDDRAGIAAAVYVEKLDQWRVSLLPGVRLRARIRLVLATGIDKAAALRWTIRSPWRPSIHPAQILTADGVETEFFLDEESAAELG